jgi:hypothetical protein
VRTWRVIDRILPGTRRAALKPAELSDKPWLIK